MIALRLLSDSEFRACFSAPMRDVTAEAEAVVDIWPYVDAIDLEGLGVPHLNDVNYVYRDASGRFDQVLIGTGRFNAMLVIVIDRWARVIAGYRLLDLNSEYGVGGGHLRGV